MKQICRRSLAVGLAIFFAGLFGLAISPTYAMQSSDGQLAAGKSIASHVPRSAAPYSPGTKFRECSECPEMTVVPAGSFQMGSPPSEEGRFDNEGPQHRVSIPQNFAAGSYHVTRAEYAAFIRDTGRTDDDGCFVWTGREWRNDPARSWRDPGFPQTERDPVTCVSWDDVQAYVLWLNKRVRQVMGSEAPGSYRLLTEAEWEYAARAGTTTPHYWGSGSIRDHANSGIDKDNTEKCPPCGPFVLGADRWEYTSPVGSFPANGFGLHDMVGNVWQWLEDCYHESYVGAPGDGTAWAAGECKSRTARGGSWIDSPRYLRPAYRGKNSGIRYTSLGFRIARTLS